jgi:uroporphyrinogen decarboxylase
MQNRLFRTLTRLEPGAPPLWMMRQAGRYLPEYRQIREQAGGFWTLCLTPELASEVTLQPIRRFDYDAAIIFSDILVIPRALGQQVDFELTHGPHLEKLGQEFFLTSPDWTKVDQILEPVYGAIRLTRSRLSPLKDLIGFTGSPWTIATYMIDGGKSRDFPLSRQALSHSKNLISLLELLTQAVARHLINQVKAGATVLQIFDSWAGLVPVSLRPEILFDPLKEILQQVRSAVGSVPIIYFGRGVSDSYGALGQENLKIALGVDQHADLEELDRLLPKDCALQGNLDPEILVAGGEQLDQAVARILKVAQNRPFVFNLGHGILPETPIPHVDRVCELVRRVR